MAASVGRERRGNVRTDSDMAGLARSSGWWTRTAMVAALSAAASGQQSTTSGPFRTSKTVVDNCGSKFTTDECDTLFSIRVICTVLSLLGLVFIAGMIIIHKTYRNLIQRLILWLTVAAFTNCLPFLFANDVEDVNDVCKAQGFIMSASDMATLLWVCTITHAMFLALTYSKSALPYEKAYHGVSWGVAAIVAFIPLFADAYGPAGVWCWITTDFQGLRFGLWYGPLYLTLILLTISNAYVVWLVNWRNKQWQGTFNPKIEEEKKFMKSTVQPLKWYPTVFVITSIFPLVNRIQNWTHDHPVFALYVLHAISSTIQGFLNAIVYFAMTEKKTWQQCTYRGIKRALKSRGHSVTEYNMTSELGPNDVNDVNEDYSDDNSDDSDIDESSHA